MSRHAALEAFCLRKFSSHRAASVSILPVMSSSGGTEVTTQAAKPKPSPPAREPDEMRDFLHVVYRSLKMICAYLEKRYHF